MLVDKPLRSFFKIFLPPREAFNTWSHLLGAIVAVIWTFFLILKADGADTGEMAAYWIYGISVVLMFWSSALYHTLNAPDNVLEHFRRFDHILIYVVIAGSYTPTCAIPLEGPWARWMLIGIWSFAILGILKKTLWMNAPRWFSTALYLLMGWVALILFPMIWDILPHAFTYWIIIGGLFYTIGAVIYGIRKPNPIPGHFGFHEIWHLFVLGGAFSHFWAIYQYLPGFNS
ncbi:PAQR family membrane homeostasis protein TrhA [Balneola sp. MJW-20]|uniref:PAQR family membrane homeostasis protein TrhA n=1 Tax=Gracilimonas aurantiaca TaxID=3234185 RepID=UPI00390C05CD